MRASVNCLPLPGTGRDTIDERVAQYGAVVAARLRPLFEQRALVYPPAEIALLAFKDTRELQLHVRCAAGDAWTFVKTYPVYGTSGGAGPKLTAGDHQVPEGVYAVEYLNPNSRFHLSLKLDYPNAFDCRMAIADRRYDLGADIMIHGGSWSIGCLAMGDAAAEDLFILAAHVGVEHVRVLISPTDFREGRDAPQTAYPSWTPVLYARLRAALAQYSRAA